jgi:hypothetical protein
MRAILFLMMLLICGALATAAHAQPAQEGILFGYDDAVEHVADLPPEVQAEIRQALDEDLNFNVGFVYRRAFVFHESFALWTWNGRFALYDGGNVLEVPPAELERVLGAQRYSALQVPRAYRWPTGLISLIFLVLIVAALIYFMPTEHRRVQRLLQDPKYTQAAEIYSASLPKDDEESTKEHREQALIAAIDFLVEKSIPRAEAAANLKKIISHHEELRSKHLRQQALAAEMAGDWNEAIDLYEEAAELRELWDEKDFEFLQKCIARVAKKQAAANSD